MNEKAKKYIEDNTLDLNKNERMDTTGYVSLAVSISKAYGALAIVEDDFIAKVADAWNYHRNSSLSFLSGLYMIWARKSSKPA